MTTAVAHAHGQTIEERISSRRRLGCSAFCLAASAAACPSRGPLPAEMRVQAACVFASLALVLAAAGAVARMELNAAFVVHG